MSQWTLYAVSGVTLLTIALFGFFTCTHLIQKIIAANLVGTGVFLVLVALARRGEQELTDPVLHALVLTGIVVSVSATALALALARRLDDPATSGSPPAGEEDDG